MNTLIAQNSLQSLTDVQKIIIVGITATVDHKFYAQLYGVASSYAVLME
jgi:hypothetical protein